MRRVRFEFDQRSLVPLERLAAAGIETQLFTRHSRGSFMIKPSVGRVVLFYSEPGAAVRPAIIVHVWGDPCINIATWDGNGTPVPNPPTSVRLVQPGETLPTSGPYCTWMDYQIGQAAKTEALEKELAAKS